MTTTTRFTITDANGRRDNLGIEERENVFASQEEADAAAENLAETTGWTGLVVRPLTEREAARA